MKRLITLLLTLSLAVSLLCTNAVAIKNVTTFEPEDVLGEEYIQKNTTSSWAADEIDAALAAGLVPTLTGNPGYRDAITREQFAELVVQAVTVICGAPEMAPADTFTDTNNPAILQAYQAGIVDGVGDNKFNPKQITNREQIATMITRAVAYIKAETGTDLAPVAGDLSKYTDKAQVSGWAVDGVGLLASNGIMKGTSDTTLSPKASCTVEQSILFVFRMYQAYQKAA